MSVLKNDAETSPQIIFADVLYVDAVVSDLPSRYVIKTVDQVGDRCFSRSGRAHKSDFLPWLGIKRNILQDFLAGTVAEGDVMETDVPF